MIERPNRTVLNQALDEFRDAMRPFIFRNMKRIKGRTIESAIYDSLSDRQASQFRANLQRNGGSIEGAIDIGDFPNLIRRNWTEVFSLQFHGDMNIQNSLYFIRQARNEASHPSNEDLDTEYTRAVLYHIVDVLGKINAPEAKASVEKERDQLFQVPSPESITPEPTESTPSTPRSGAVIPPKLIVDPENKFTFYEIYVSLYDYDLFNRFTQTRA